MLGRVKQWALKRITDPDGFHEAMDRFQTMSFEDLRNEYWDILRTGKDGNLLRHISTYVTTRVMTNYSIGTPIEAFDYGAAYERNHLDPGLEKHTDAVSAHS